MVTRPSTFLTMAELSSVSSLQWVDVAGGVGQFLHKPHLVSCLDPCLQQLASCGCSESPAHS